MDEVERVLEKEVDPRVHLMSDEWKAFVAVGQSFAAHETVQHARREYVRGPVHANSVEGFNLRVHARWLASFITSAPSMPTSISTKSASAGRSASPKAKSSGELGTAVNHPHPLVRVPPAF